MNKLKVWAIDDDSKALSEIMATLGKIKRQISFTLEIKTSEDWQWPPRLRDADDNSVETVNIRSARELPDILILDLYEDAKYFRGGPFYEHLREQEQANRKQPEAFVIIRSGYWDYPESMNFVEQNRREGSHFIVLASKAEKVLIEAILGCIGRIEERS